MAADRAASTWNRTLGENRKDDWTEEILGDPSGSERGGINGSTDYIPNLRLNSMSSKKKKKKDSAA